MTERSSGTTVSIWGSDVSLESSEIVEKALVDSWKMIVVSSVRFGARNS